MPIESAGFDPTLRRRLRAADISQFSSAEQFVFRTLSLAGRNFTEKLNQTGEVVLGQFLQTDVVLLPKKLTKEPKNLPGLPACFDVPILVGLVLRDQLFPEIDDGVSV